MQLADAWKVHSLRVRNTATWPLWRKDESLHFPSTIECDLSTAILYSPRRCKCCQSRLESRRIFSFCALNMRTQFVKSGKYWKALGNIAAKEREATLNNKLCKLRHLLWGRLYNATLDKNNFNPLATRRWQHTQAACFRAHLCLGKPFVTSRASREKRDILSSKVVRIRYRGMG